MGIRLKGFDYKRPYFYMVTIKRTQGFKEKKETSKRQNIFEVIQND